MTHDERESHLHSLLLSLIHQTAAETPCVFGVDDAHLVDEQSWPFLLDLASDPNTLLVVSLKSGKLKRLHSTAAEALQTHAKLLDLVGLSQSEIVELACQLLDTDSIPADLERILVEKTHGIPLWCEELVSSMVESGLLQVTEEGLNKTTPAVSTDNTKQGRKKRIVHFKRSIRPEDISIPDSITGLILARFDHLPADAQLVLKSASVLGTTFSRPMLATIVPSRMAEEVFNQAIVTLASHGLIECYHATQVGDHSGSTVQLTEKVKCPCLPLRQLHSIVPSAAIQLVGSSKHSAEFINDCQLLKFVHPYVRDTLYDLWTDRQRKKLHKRAALCLECQAHRCENCGGGGFTILGTATTKPTARQSSRQQERAFTGTATRTVIQRNRRRGLIRNLLRNAVHPSDVPPETEAQVPRQQCSSDHGISSKGLSSKPHTLFDLQDCYCDEILSKVYPQLILHWKEEGSKDKVLHYLMEAAGAAVTTFNNMEALSLLHEAQQLSREEDLSGNFTQHDEAKRESLVGQVSHRLFSKCAIGSGVTTGDSRMRVDSQLAF